MDNHISTQIRVWKQVRAVIRGPLVALIVLFVLLCLTTPSFLDPANFINIMGQITIWGLLAFGMTFVIISGGIDLSVGNVLSFATMVFGWTVKVMGLPVGVAIILTILAGGLCGLGSGLMVTKAKLPPFIATLSMLYISRGLAHLLIKEGQQFIDYPDWFVACFFKNYFGFLSVTTALFIALIILCWIFLAHREAGRNLYAVGGSPEVARLAGIRVALVTTGAYVVSGVLAGLAGVVYASRVNASTPLAGNGYELNAIAIAVIGGASLRGGVGTIEGTVIGALIVGFLMNALNLHNMSPHVQTITIGVIIAVSVFFDMLSRRKKIAS